MTTKTDARFAALRTQGFVGATNDMVLQWLQANGATSGAISDAWKQMLDIIQPPPPSHRADQWSTWLRLNGYGTTSGNRNDAELDFWGAGGLLVPKPSENGSFSVSFSKSFSGGFNG